MDMKIYQFAVILNPTEKEEEEGKKPELIVPITSILAGSDQAAVMMAGRAIPEEHVEHLDRCQVAVSPF